MEEGIYCQSYVTSHYYSRRLDFHQVCYKCGAEADLIPPTKLKKVCSKATTRSVFAADKTDSTQEWEERTKSLMTEFYLHLNLLSRRVRNLIASNCIPFLDVNKKSMTVVWYDEIQ